MYLQGVGRSSEPSYTCDELWQPYGAIYVSTIQPKPSTERTAITKMAIFSPVSSHLWVAGAKGTLRNVQLGMLFG